MAKSKGAGCWEARRMEVDRPNRAGERIDAVVVYNTATKEARVSETLGADLERHFRDNPDEMHTREELIEIYMREAREWAADLNRES